MKKYLIFLTVFVGLTSMASAQREVIESPIEEQVVDGLIGRNIFTKKDLKLDLNADWITQCGPAISRFKYAECLMKNRTKHEGFISHRNRLKSVIDVANAYFILAIERVDRGVNDCKISTNTKLIRRVEFLIDKYSYIHSPGNYFYENSTETIWMAGWCPVGGSVFVNPQ